MKLTILRARTLILGLNLLALLLFSLRNGQALDVDKDLRQCRLDVWTNRDGLPQRDIEAMAQTPDGYLWLGSRSGLVRFDGNTFTRISAPEGAGDRSGIIRALYTDPVTGDLWVGTDGGGFGPLIKGKIQPIQVPGYSETWNEQMAFLRTRDGSLWVGCAGMSGLLQFRSGKLQFQSNTYGFVNALAEDAHGNLWLGTQWSGLVRRSPDGTFRVYANAPGPGTRPITCLLATREGGLWVGTQGAGLFYFKDGKFLPQNRRQGWAYGDVLSLQRDRAGNLWVGASRGLLRREKTGNFTVFNRGDGLYSNRVNSLLEDYEGNLWVGAGHGLHRFANTRLTPLSVTTVDDSSALTTACAAPDGSVWFGTTQSLLQFRAGRWTRYAIGQGQLPSTVNSLWPASDGGLWIGCDNGSILKAGHGRLTPILRKPGGNTLAEDREGLVITSVDAQNRWSICRLREGAGARWITLPANRPLGYIFGFYKDRRGTLWFGSENGLGHIDRGHVTLTSDGLPANTHVLWVSEYQDALWLATDHGLARYRGGKITLFAHLAGMPECTPSTLQVTADGVLWLGTETGIYEVRIADIEAYEQGRLTTVPCVGFDAASGMVHPPKLPAGFADARGRVWFFGQQGATIIDPRAMPTNRLRPQVFIEQIRDHRITHDITPGMTLPAGASHVEIKYTATSLTDATRMQFRYQLEGFDHGWIDAGTRRMAYYTNLPPGDYTFHVIACNNDGLWNTVGAELHFTVQPFYWQTIWFRVLCVLVAAASVLLLVRLRLIALQRRNTELALNVAAQTRELRLAYDRLAHTNHELRSAHDELEAMNLELEVSNDELAEANARLASLATTDAMTGLANHRAFQERLQVELAQMQRTGQPLALLLLDVDQFKQYNDSYGHPAGDEVLREVGRILRTGIREYDMAARYGGEEFALLLPGLGRAEAREVAERVRLAVEAHAFVHREVTISIGVAEGMFTMASTEELVERADGALYEAKRSGRNRVVVAEANYQPGPPPNTLLAPANGMPAIMEA
jgi:diguanylate cyclase (GGDEF)-like protein